MFDIFMLTISYGIWTLLAYGSLIAAVAVYLGVGQIQIPGPAKPYVMAVCVGVSLYSFGYINGRNNDHERIIQLTREIEKTNKLLQKEQEAAQQAQLEKERLSGVIDGYVKELENGTTFSCDVDPVLNQRLRDILNGEGFVSAK